tara:strand:- start:424 stop:636 length:213 start_codon:yes stop_codon:yes gene_type:complete
MQDETAIYRILKKCRDRRDEVKEQLSVGVKDFATYQNLVGQVAAFNYLEQEIKDLPDEDTETDRNRNTKT